ncbi:hypothetical protein BGW38_006416 [Lunasporangiospora selenospora]|uniref:Concentrative nucleoside transporter, CNT family n=1 Tax=Lunasporangiospora selenospora TaxID=979761 RepID=A0A9P6G519_9FUNG|nr:hypothetical protein BGW38_006416 [Lunasporangiospora selenospora]
MNHNVPFAALAAGVVSQETLSVAETVFASGVSDKGKADDGRRCGMKSKELERQISPPFRVSSNTSLDNDHSGQRLQTIDATQARDDPRKKIKTEEFKVDEFKATIQLLEKQEQEIIQSLRGNEHPQTVIDRHIKQLHRYNKIKDVGQTILGKLCNNQKPVASISVIAAATTVTTTKIMSRPPAFDHPHAIDDEKLDYIESQPPSDAEDDLPPAVVPTLTHRQHNNVNANIGHQHNNSSNNTLSNNNNNRNFHYDEKRPPSTTGSREGSLYDTKEPVDADPNQPSSRPPSVYTGRFAFYHNNKTLIKHLIVFAVCTGLFIPAVVIHVEGNILVLSLLYAVVVWWLIVQHLPENTIAGPVGRLWHGGAGLVNKLPLWLQRAIGFGLPPVALILTAALRPDDEYGTRVQRLISCLGLVVLLCIPILFSKNRKAISWKIVWTGIFIQYILGILIIRWSVGYDVFQFISEQAKNFLSFAEQGREFIFGPSSITYNGEVIPFAGSFAASVLPAIILFAAVIQCLYYWNVIQSVVASMARLVIHIIDISGVECVAACAAPFVGMSEASMLVGPFVNEMTEAEMHQVLTSGFATISGSVFLGLLTFGADATALLTCCMMSVPCAIVISKIRFPEEGTPLTKGTAVSPAYKDRESNAIHAISNGAIFGIKLCIVIIAVLLAVISLLGLVNGFLGWIFRFYGVSITVEKIASWILYPLAWLIGIPSSDLMPAAEAMGIKFILNEFAAFAAFTQIQDTLQPRTRLLTTYAMASFANIGSIGSQISLFMTLAPDRAGAVARLSFSACLCGAVSTLISACIAGIVS